MHNQTKPNLLDQDKLREEYLLYGNIIDGNFFNKIIQATINISIRLIFFLIPNELMKKVLFRYIKIKKGVVVFYDDNNKNKILDLIYKIKKETKLLLFDNEALQLYTAVKNAQKIKGSLAEVGVFKGGSAKIICEAKDNRNLYLFDTFSGIPQVKKIDQPNFYVGKYSCHLEEVKKYLKKYKNVFFINGVFPLSAENLKKIKFSFVHLDVDTYKDTLNSLKYFYPKINRGGVIIIHDYLWVEGVKKAVNNYFFIKKEPVIELSGTQCLIIKI